MRLESTGCAEVKSEPNHFNVKEDTKRGGFQMAVWIKQLNFHHLTLKTCKLVQRKQKSPNMLIVFKSKIACYKCPVLNLTRTFAKGDDITVKSSGQIL